jgi:hypothetical protein
MLNPDIGAEVWPRLQVDTALHQDFRLIDVDVSHVAQHLTDRGVMPDVVNDHALALKELDWREFNRREAAAHYRYEESRIDLYPEAAIGQACLEWVVEAAQANDWQRPLGLVERTKLSLDGILTHELQHLVDFTKPGAYEATVAYNVGTNRMLRRYGHRLMGSTSVISALPLAAAEAIYTFNPTASPILACLGILMVGGASLNGFTRRVQTFAMALREVRYHNNPFESRAIAAADTERGDFFTVDLTPDTVAEIQEFIDVYRKYVLRA